MIELRVFSADDWALWRTLRLAALTDTPTAFGSKLEKWADAPEKRWRDRLSIPNAWDLVAFVPKGLKEGEVFKYRRDAPMRPAGMASGIPTNTPGRAELISMWVDPTCRRHGVATELIESVVSWAATWDYEELVLAVRRDNDAARETYLRNGFVVSDEPGDEVEGGEREIVMVRRLRPKQKNGEDDV
ncbi:acyl-CoA N-acyltransferase [Xylariales sp. PMI_506]|nr:acyl-CoA N-acyltransferase [Xylariales sp. PMI_506]